MKIVLTMIVKDEEHVIERALQSCVNLIDAYCIVDTGSTDKTKQVITDFFAKHKRIQGEIVDMPFTTYSECRNRTIEEGKKFGDWGFWIDADEELVFNKKWNRNNFKAEVIKNKPDQLLFDCAYGTMKYQRAQMFRFDSGFYWYGPVHEVLRTDNPDKNNISGFPYGHVFIRAEGNSWSGDISKKYEDHAKILLDYQEENKWEDPRWTFYLAQSFKDSALPVLQKNPKDDRALDLAKKAINFYRDRIEAKGGFDQEVYYSQLMIARISYFFMSMEHVMYEFHKCEEYNTHNRVEHIFDLSTICQRNKLWRNGKLICDHGHNILQSGKTSSNLFMEPDLYTWRFYDSYSIILYYNNFAQESMKLIDHILDKYGKQMPKHEKERIENNKKLTENSIRQSGIQLPDSK